MARNPCCSWLHTVVLAGALALNMVDRRMVNPAQAPLNRMRTPSPAVPWNGKCKDCVLQQQSLQFLTQQKHCRSFQIDPNGFLFSFDECTGRNSWLELCVFTCFHFDWLFWEKVRRSIFFLQFPGMQCFLYVLVVQSVATVAPLVCWPKVMTQVPAESWCKLAQAEVSFPLDPASSSWDSADCRCS